jgi:hypothetical protein
MASRLDRWSEELAVLRRLESAVFAVPATAELKAAVYAMGLPAWLAQAEMYWVVDALTQADRIKDAVRLTKMSRSRFYRRLRALRRYTAYKPDESSPEAPSDVPGLARELECAKLHLAEIEKRIRALAPTEPETK